jgi:hypothetical protein
MKKMIVAFFCLAAGAFVYSFGVAENRGPRFFYNRKIERRERIIEMNLEALRDDAEQRGINLGAFAGRDDIPLQELLREGIRQYREQEHTLPRELYPIYEG